MINILSMIDIQITQFINALIPHDRFFDLFFTFFSMIGTAAVIWVIFMLILIIFEEKRRHSFIIYFAVSLAATLILVNGIKNIIKRPRPLTDIRIENSVNHYKTRSYPEDYSFPSGHAATAFTAAVVLSSFDKKRRWFYYLIAVIISLSRIYLYVHYFLDVGSGMIIGWMIGRVILLIPQRH